MQAVARGWCLLGSAWFGMPRGAQRGLSICLVQSAGLAGLEALSLTCAECRRIDSSTAKKLRAMERGKANWLTEQGEHRTYKNAELFRRWRLAPCAVELTIRRSRWAQSWAKHPENKLHLLTICFGELACESPPPHLPLHSTTIFASLLIRTLGPASWLGTSTSCWTWRGRANWPSCGNLGTCANCFSTLRCGRSLSESTLPKLSPRTLIGRRRT